MHAPATSGKKFNELWTLEVIYAHPLSQAFDLLLGPVIEFALPHELVVFAHELLVTFDELNGRVNSLPKRLVLFLVKLKWAMLRTVDFVSFSA